MERSFDAKLRALRREIELSTKRRRRRLQKHPAVARLLALRAWRPPEHWAATLALGAAKVACIVALPFLTYVRGSTELYEAGVGPWGSVFGALVLTVGSIVGIAFVLSRRLAGVRRSRVQAAVRWVAVPAVVLWCGFALFNLSIENAKSEDVRQHFSHVHPVLRVALATAILFDPGMIVTDLARVSADYPRMGLPVNERTRHYRQQDGYVHAVDLRTRERGEIRNRMLQLYFWTMGFSTRRHVGTADHLHVQITARE